MRKVSSFVLSILGGAAIALGGVVYLSVDNSVIGAFLFAVGLFTVYTFGLNLFTGKVCYIFENPPGYTLFVLSVWAGNLVGTGLVGLAVRQTRIAGIAERAAVMCATKLGDTPVSIFILAIFCNIMICIAAENYRSNPHEIGKYIAIFIGVMVFILAGFEHCVANMFYFTVAGAWSGKAVLYLLIMTLGNTVGGVILPLSKRLESNASI